MKKNLKKKGRENLPFIYIIGQGGFEPPTPWSRTKCASPCATIRNNQCSLNTDSAMILSLYLLYVYLHFYLFQNVEFW